MDGKYGPNARFNASSILKRSSSDPYDLHSRASLTFWLGFHPEALLCRRRSWRVVADEWEERCGGCPTRRHNWGFWRHRHEGPARSMEPKGQRVCERHAVPLDGVVRCTTLSRTTGTRKVPQASEWTAWWCSVRPWSGAKEPPRLWRLPEVKPRENQEMGSSAF